ncbi:MAG: SAM-dependent methyltransferase [Pseudonocardiaceae bacterium]
MVVERPDNDNPAAEPASRITFEVPHSARIWNDAFIELCEGYTESGGVPYIPRSVEQIGRCFEGLEIVDPGLVSITQWLPDTGKDEPMDAAYGAVARKP